MGDIRISGNSITRRVPIPGTRRNKNGSVPVVCEYRLKDYCPVCRKGVLATKKNFENGELDLRFVCGAEITVQGETVVWVSYNCPRGEI